MGYSIGYSNGRDIGYAVPAPCDQPGCEKEIDRGMSYCCGSFRSDDGCGLYFCEDHLYYHEDTQGDSAEFCDVCVIYLKLLAIDPDTAYKSAPAGYDPKPDLLKWVIWKLYDQSWERWRRETPKEVEALQARERQADKREVRRLLKELEPDMEQNQ